MVPVVLKIRDLLNAQEIRSKARTVQFFLSFFQKQNQPPLYTTKSQVPPFILPKVLKPAEV